MATNKRQCCSYLVQNTIGHQTKVLVWEENLTNKFYDASKDIARHYTELMGGFLGWGFDSIKNRCTHLLVASRNDDPKIVGFCAFEEGKAKTGKKVLHVLQIAVDTNSTHMGVGKAMLKYLEEHSKGFDAILSEVNRHNIASICLFGGQDYLKSKNTNSHNQHIMYKNTDNIEGRKKLNLAPQKFHISDNGYYATSKVFRK